MEPRAAAPPAQPHRHRARPLTVDPFAPDLPRNAANHVPLTPVSFLARSALVYPEKIAVVHGRLAFTYREFAARCARLASALARRGIGRGDVVAVMAPNVPALLELHYAVPALGAVLNPLNVRLDAATIAFCLRHGGAKALVTDAEFASVVQAALEFAQRDLADGGVQHVLHLGRQEHAGQHGVLRVVLHGTMSQGDPGQNPVCSGDHPTGEAKEATYFRYL